MNPHTHERARKFVSACSSATIILWSSVASASSWNPGYLVNTEAFQVIDDTNTAADLALKFGDTIDKSLTYQRTLARFRLDDDLSVVGTVSGSIVKADLSLQSSGSLIVEGNMSGGTLEGAGLYDCDDGTNSKLLWNVSTKKFSCGSDQGGVGGGLSFSAAEGIYVNQAGDTMTGALRINVSNGSFGTLGLRVNNTASGAHVHAEQMLSASGQLIVEGNLTFGDAITDAITVNAGSWTFANATNFAVSNAVNAFSIDTDTLSVDATNNRIGIRTTAPENPLEVVGTISGTTLKTSNGINASGAIITEGNMSGATLQGAGLYDCDTASTSKLLWDATTKKFSCGSDQGGSGMGLMRINGSSGAAGSDMTWQNLTANSSTCGTTALCSAIMTTTGVGAGTWKFKYTLIWQSAATATGIGFGINHTGTVGEFQALWYGISTGGTAATGTFDSDTTTGGGQMAEGKHDNGLNAVIGSASAGVDAANADQTAILEGIIVVTATGQLELKIASEVASSNVLVKADSTLELMKIE